ncbi:response regulator [Halorussus litoreus]|uniref:response regulator n=1 Tax=Halorussus litoreus TaxID=1710536 RepID=UPI00130092ED|nr:response regulator [Halorussus litoreus]
MPDKEKVLVIDDDRPLADGFARALSSEYDVRTAYSVEQARESLDPDIDAVLLDRRLPDGSGDELLEEIRDRDHDYRVAMVSGESPDPNLDCDTYVTKPLAGTDAVQETVEELLASTLST